MNEEKTDIPGGPDYLKMKNKEVIKNDITFIEACKILGKSGRTLSRYIKKGLLNPEKIKTEKGTILLN